MKLLNNFLVFAVICIMLLSLCSCDLVGDPEGKQVFADVPSSPSQDSSQTSDDATPPSLSGGESSPSTDDGNSEISDSAAPDTTASESPSAGESAAPASLSGSTDSSFELSGSALLDETDDQGQSYIDSMTFLGDSTTYGMKYYAVLSDGKDTKQVWTPSNGTLTLSYQSFVTIVYPEDGSEITIRDAVSRAQPDYLVITLGVNGISFMDEDYFKSEYTSLVTDIQSLSPNTKIILQSIFPVAQNYEYLNSINNDKISQANAWVLDVAEKTGAKFLNTASALVGSDGWLPQEYQNGDGLHLNESGFAVVISYIRTHGYN